MSLPLQSNGVVSEKQNEDIEKLQEFFHTHSWIRFIQFRWVDLSGLSRTRIVTKEYCFQLMAVGKPFQMARIALQTAIDNSFAPPGLDAVGSDCLYPDWTSLRAIEGANGRNLSYAMVMCTVLSKSYGRDASSIEDVCPRRALLNVLETAKQRFDMDFLVGFEVEFAIMQPVGNREYVPHSSGYGLNAHAALRDKSFKMVEECLDDLLNLGVQIQSIHSEGAQRGQYEISLGPLPPLEAVDQLVLVHNTLKDLMCERGYQVTMSPKPTTSSLANGQHVHISIHPPTQETLFLSGLLRHLRSICAFTLPYELSYQRVKSLLAGEEVTWGTQNRTAPIRKIKPGHWELRCVDATANMYISLAAIFSAGLTGITNNETLLWPDITIPIPIPVNHDLENGTPTPTKTEDVSPPTQPHQPQFLPRSLTEALDALEDNNDDIQRIIGGHSIPYYIRLKRYEIERLRAMKTQDVTNLFIELF